MNCRESEDDSSRTYHETYTLCDKLFVIRHCVIWLEAKRFQSHYQLDLNELFLLLAALCSCSSFVLAFVCLASTKKAATIAPEWCLFLPFLCVCIPFSPIRSLIFLRVCARANVCVRNFVYFTREFFAFTTFYWYGIVVGAFFELSENWVHSFTHHSYRILPFSIVTVLLLLVVMVVLLLLPLLLLWILFLSLLCKLIPFLCALSLFCSFVNSHARFLPLCYTFSFSFARSLAHSIFISFSPIFLYFFLSLSLSRPLRHSFTFYSTIFFLLLLRLPLFLAVCSFTFFLQWKTNHYNILREKLTRL